MSVYPERRKGKLTGKWLAEPGVANAQRRKTFDTHGEAQGWHDTIKLTGQAPAAKALTKSNTLGEVCDAAKLVLWKSGKDPSAIQRLDACVAFLKPDTAIEEVTTTQLDKLVTHLEKRGGKSGGAMSPSTINRYLSALSAVFTFAVPRKLVLVAPELPWQKAVSGRIHWYTDAMEATVCTYLETRKWRDESLCVRVLGATGMRLGELMNLAPADIGDEWINLYADNTKTALARTVPIAHSLAVPLRLMVSKKRLPKPDLLRTRVKAACKSAGYSAGLCLHSFRHSTATRLVKKGVNLAIVKKFLGHKALTTTLKYTHVEDADLQAASKLLTPHVGESIPVENISPRFAEVNDADVAELVDASDLKSVGAKAPSRFESGRRHQHVRVRHKPSTTFAGSCSNAALSGCRRRGCRGRTTTG